MKIEISKGAVAAISVTAAAVVTAAFLSGYRIGHNERREEIFDLECELKMMGRITDGMSEDMAAIRLLLSSDKDTTAQEVILPAIDR